MLWLTRTRSWARAVAAIGMSLGPIRRSEGATPCDSVPPRGMSVNAVGPRARVPSVPRVARIMPAPPGWTGRFSVSNCSYSRIASIASIRAFTRGSGFRRGGGISGSSGVGWFSGSVSGRPSHFFPASPPSNSTIRRSASGSGTGSLMYDLPVFGSRSSQPPCAAAFFAPAGAGAVSNACPSFSRERRAGRHHLAPRGLDRRGRLSGALLLRCRTAPILAISAAPRSGLRGGLLRRRHRLRDGPRGLSTDSMNRFSRVPPRKTSSCAAVQDPGEQGLLERQQRRACRARSCPGRRS